MNRMSLFLLLLAAAGLCSCSGSRVVLLDSGKTQNAIVVSNAAGETVLDQVNSYADISSEQTPIKIKTMSPSELNQNYGDLIAAAPKKPAKFLLYFEPNGTLLTPASTEQLADIRAAILDRIPCEVNIIGHADSSGSKEYNIELSLQRARRINQWLSAQDLEIMNVIVESFGEEDPLIPTADGVLEPRNRRVELLVR